MYSVLYVDDETELLEIGRMYLEEDPELHVDTAASALLALDLIRSNHYDVIVSDYMMPRMNGIAFLKEVRTRFGDTPFILFTGRGREEVVIDAINNGADFFLQKGGDPDAQFAELAHKIKKSAEIRKDKEAIEESKQRLADIINFLPDAIFAIDMTGAVIAWNRAIEEMTGVPASAILGKGNHEYAVPFYGKRRPLLINLLQEPAEEIEKTYRIQKRGKDFLIAETAVPNLQGRSVYLLGRASFLYDRTGAVAGAIESIRDISETKLAEKSLKESEELFRTFYDASPDGVVLLDPDGTITHASALALTQCGIESLDEVKDTSVFAWIHEDDRPAAQEAFRLLNSRGGISQGKEYRVKRKNGSFFPAAINISVITGPDGRVSGNVAIVRDITVRKRTEKNLQESEEKFRTLIEQSLDGIIIVDFTGILLYANPMACRIVEAKNCQELIGKASIFDFLLPEHHARARYEFTRVKDGEDNYPVIYQISTRTGREIWIESIGKNITFAETPAMLISIRDITSRKMAEDALRNANRKLNILSSITRHDIVNELLALDGFVSLLGKTVQEKPEASALISRIRRVSKKIGDQIRFTKDYEDLGVHESVWQDIATIARMAAHDTLPDSMELVISPGKYEIFADPMLMLVFYNLFDNVRRHGEKATRVTVSFTEQGAEGILVVEDNGPGIPPDMRDGIFEKGMGKHTGFGLFLSREILAITGLEISENGVTGAGARFEIRAPAGRWRSVLENPQ